MLCCDRSLEQRFDELIKTHCAHQKGNKQPATVALLIGRRTESEDLVLIIPSVPLPESVCTIDESQKDPKQGRTPKPAGDCLDAEWVAQHAHQVLRMVPGGLSIIGLVLLGEKTALRDLHSTMLKSLKLIWRSEQSMRWRGSIAERMRLVNVEVPLGKPACIVVENFSSGLAKTSPSRIAFQHLQWLPLEAQVGVSERFFIPEGLAQRNFQQMFMGTVDPFVQKFNAATAVVDGKMRNGSEPLVAKKGGKKRSDGSQEDSIIFDFLLPYSEKKEAPINGNVISVSGGSLVMKGKFSCMAVVDSKATVEEAKEAVKEDLCRSLYSRVELHYEGMLVTEGDENNESTAIHQLPRRVYAAHPLHSDLFFCDYLFEGDTTSDSVESFHELLQIEIVPEDVCDNQEVGLSIENLEELGLTLPDEESLESSSEASTPRKKVSQHSTESLSTSSVLYYVLTAMVVALAFIVYMLLN